MSRSGLLEVGKINKLKIFANNKRKEQEGKEKRESRATCLCFERTLGENAALKIPLWTSNIK